MLTTVIAGAAMLAFGLLVPVATAQRTASAEITGFSQASAGAALPAGWLPLTLEGIESSRYTLVRDGARTVLRAEAHASASGLAFAFSPPVAQSWRLRWRWKGERLPASASIAQRATDDAVARVYVTFRRPPEQLSTAQRAMDAMLRTLYGEAPPHATLLYAWDNEAAVGTSGPNAFSDRVRNIVVESGSARLSQWLAYERDVAADYRAAFGDAPPPISGVAVMTDADNTRSRAVAYYGDITLSVD